VVVGHQFPASVVVVDVVVIDASAASVKLVRAPSVLA
jgi:hypothetical protein